MSGYTTLASCQSGCLLRLQLDFSENISLSLPQKVSLVLHLAKSLKEYKFVKTFFFGFRPGADTNFGIIVLPKSHSLPVRKNYYRRIVHLVKTYVDVYKQFTMPVMYICFFENRMVKA